MDSILASAPVVFSLMNFLDMSWLTRVILLKNHTYNLDQRCNGPGCSNVQKVQPQVFSCVLLLSPSLILFWKEQILKLCSRKQAERTSHVPLAPHQIFPLCQACIPVVSFVGILFLNFADTLHLC
ncbi:hypothetical protein C8J55DRAFT_524119 [Lentinula edodes]|uniref:Uncharacterized protein n=1 Tax=Lentinula lateritia TaxID=40482 RepID=A0A9W8ZXB4_9AGAR|nr:hypothetical protein C8J55DRAFT_524119 [Lentinula edodes]